MIYGNINQPGASRALNALQLLQLAKGYATGAKMKAGCKCGSDTCRENSDMLFNVAFAVGVLATALAENKDIQLAQTLKQFCIENLKEYPEAELINFQMEDFPDVILDSQEKE